MTEKFYVDTEGKYLGSFSAPKGVQAETPDGIEVPYAPESVQQVWSFATNLWSSPPKEKVLVSFADALERLTPAEWDKVDQLESSSKQFKMWIRRALSQGSLNVNSPEFAQARTAVTGLGIFTAARFDEIFAP